VEEDGDAITLRWTCVENIVVNVLVMPRFRIVAGQRFWRGVLESQERQRQDTNKSQDKSQDNSKGKIQVKSPKHKEPRQDLRHVTRICELWCVHGLRLGGLECGGLCACPLQTELPKILGNGVLLENPNLTECLPHFCRRLSAWLFSLGGVAGPWRPETVFRNLCWCLGGCCARFGL
jgi:hypothetical protein